ncbi:MAG TPA: cytochrome P450 [Pseudonocardiaceae bacterium]|nr:cytochrome P450 [Pseudonocardiaceae bacterium]
MTTLDNLSSTQLFTQILDPATRPNPYPLYRQLQRQPVSRTDDNFWIISTHREISQLLRDPRTSADLNNQGAANARPTMTNPDGTRFAGPFLTQDPPGHDRLRHAVTQQFIPRVMSMRDHLEHLVTTLLDAHTGDRPGELDIVTDLAYPLPVTVICELLGVSPKDEAIFGDLARRLTRGLDPVESQTEADLRELAIARTELTAYLTDLIAFRRQHPDDGMLYGLMTTLGPLDLHATVELLLIAGHETTVNLITNGTFTLLRNPAALARLRDEPTLVTPLVEEVLRYEPPVRRALADIDIADATIPAGSRIRLMLAAGNRDPRVFTNPDTFVPDRAPNPHLAYGGGIHYCVGATLARTEAQLTLTALAQRLQAPRLVDNPPPYRDNAVLRGPEHLRVAFGALLP